MELQILLERPGDAAEISRLTEAAFALAERSSGTEALIVEELRRRDRLSLSLVALHDSRLVGHVAFSPVTLLSGLPGWFGFAVSPGLVLPDVAPEYFQAISFAPGVTRAEVAYDPAFFV